MANKLTTFEDFLLNQPAQIDLVYLITSLIIAIILSFVLSKLYIKYGTSISNRRKLASNFILLATTTTLIITVVKSSLALSLGLVGALSIVRFRAAIKEPEELAFLFISISIGLGLGANQIAVTLVSFMMISLIIFGRHFHNKKIENLNLYLNISGKLSNYLTLKNIVNILNKYCRSVHLKRFDKSDKGILETSFVVDFDSFSKLEAVKKELETLSESVNITYLDGSGIQ